MLRRVADRIDPPPPAPAEEVRTISRAELREIQRRAAQDVLDVLEIVLRHDRDTAMAWLPEGVLVGMAALAETELETRERDFEAALR